MFPSLVPDPTQEKRFWWHLANPANLGSYFLSWKFEVSWLSTYMDSQKLDAILCEPCSCYGSASAQNGLRSNLRASTCNFSKFPGGASHRPPLVLHGYACIHSTLNSPPCNPPSKNPGYRPNSTTQNSFTPHGRSHDKPCPSVCLCLLVLNSQLIVLAQSSLQLQPETCS